jgi:hypothetical protein
VDSGYPDHPFPDSFLDEWASVVASDFEETVDPSTHLTVDTFHEQEIPAMPHSLPDNIFEARESVV